VLVAFGGAGPLQACEVARELSIPTVVIPPNPGLTSALGLLATDLSYDYSLTQLQLLSQPDVAKLKRDYAALEETAGAQLKADGMPGERTRLLRIAECRYQGQGYELRVPAPAGEVDARFIESLKEGFHRVHEREYSRFFPDKDIELVTIRVVGVGEIPALRPNTLPAGSSEPERGALAAHRPVVFDDGGKPHSVSTPHYDRTRLLAGNVIRGPAVVEQVDTTTLILPGFVAEVHPSGSLLIRLD